MSDKKISSLIKAVADVRELSKTWTTELYANGKIDRDAFKEALRSLGYSEAFIELYE